MIINSARNPIIVLDFGSQYTQLIARRIRELGVYCEIYPCDVDFAQLKSLDPCGIILSGGPATVVYEHNPRAPQWIFDSQLPVLGICYGMQLMAVQLGGKVAPSSKREFGYTQVTVVRKSFLLEHIFDRKLDNHQEILDVWMSHGDKVTELPQDFEIIGTTDNTSIAAMAHRSRHWYGLQFHPEVTHTTQGMRILEKFVINICHAPANWTPSSIIKSALENITKTVGKDKVLLGLSGGVDSSVVALLLDKAIGKQLVCVFVDTGLLRLNEAAEVIDAFKHLDINIIAVNAEQKFIQTLAGVTCPEQKRKIIGRLFIEVFEEQAKKLQGIKWLAQGTIYSDVIESAATSTNHTASVIKSHHNVGGLPERLNFKLIEPLRELFKDEVRKVGQALGLGVDLLKRHPFPGVGLGVRILGEVTKEYADILRHADAIFIEELIKNQLYDKVSQAFAVFLPVKSVGVVGDGRAYEYVICLRAVETVDFMTAHWAHLPWDFLGHVSNRIINEVAHVSRVTYDISGKPPATIEWE